MNHLIFKNGRDFKELEKYGFKYKIDKNNTSKNRYIASSNKEEKLIIIESTREVLIYSYGTYARIPILLFRLLGDDMLDWKIEK